MVSLGSSYLTPSIHSLSLRLQVLHSEFMCGCQSGSVLFHNISFE